MSRGRGGYTTGSVTELLENYDVLRARAGTYGYRLYILAGLMDIDRALQILTPKQLEAAFLMGRAGMSDREVADRLGIDRKSVWERYQHAVARMTTYLNTGRRT